MSGDPDYLHFTDNETEKQGHTAKLVQGPGFGPRGSLVPNRTDLKDIQPRGIQEKPFEEVSLDPELRWMDDKEQPWDGGEERAPGRKSHMCEGLESEETGLFVKEQECEHGARAGLRGQQGH